MEEAEVPLEDAQEQIGHHAIHSREQWTLGVALTSALLAALAAVTSLLAGHHSNEAMVDRILAADQWNYYQAKGIKASLLSMKLDLLKANDKAINPKDDLKVGEYKKEQDEIQTAALEKERASEEHLRHHLIFARAVTMFQVAIAIAAISVLTRRRRFWMVSLVFGAVGIAFGVQGFMPK